MGIAQWLLNSDRLGAFNWETCNKSFSADNFPRTIGLNHLLSVRYTRLRYNTEKIE